MGSTTTTETVVGEGTYYKATQAYLEKVLADIAAYIRYLKGLEEQAARQWQEEKVATQEATQICPICGGRMLSVAALDELARKALVRVMWEGEAVSLFGQTQTPLQWAISYNERVPTDYECQICGGFPTEPPDPKGYSRHWLRDDMPRDSKALAALVFEQFPHVEEVVYQVTSADLGWLFRVGLSEWFYYAGPRARVVERLDL